MSNLIDILENVMKRDYDLILSGVTVQKKEVSIMFSDGKTVNAVNVIPIFSQIPEAIGSCSSYMHAVHKIYIALPDKEMKKISYERKVLKEMGIGLISFSPKNYSFIMESRQNNPETHVLNTILKRLHQMEKIRTASDTYKALSHPTRLQIYLLISKRGTAQLKEITEELGGCYPLIIKHIKVLEESGLIESDKSRKETTLNLKSYPLDLKEMMGNVHAKKGNIIKD